MKYERSPAAPSPRTQKPARHKWHKWHKGKPILPAVVLVALVLACLFCEGVMTKDPAYLDLAHPAAPPSREFLLGTDTLGRDIFSMLWCGGRVSLFIGAASTLLSTAIAVAVGAASALSPPWLDRLLMRGTEILLSIPHLLLVVFLQAILGKPNALSIALVIGATSWAGIAKVVRTEARQLRTAEYVLASRAMGAGFFHILRRHLLPNLFPSIMFMVVMNIRSAIAAESTLSFMGLGLPVETVSWGSMLSLSETALLSGAWWILLPSGLTLTTTLLCITELANYLRQPPTLAPRGL